MLALPKAFAAPKEYARGGAPSKYSSAVANEICARIADGETLTAICMDRHMPHRVTVTHWLADSRFTSFASRCARARELQADFMDEQIMEVVEKVLAGTVDPYAGKVAISAFQWRASKLMPKRYGDRVQAESNVPVSLGVLIGNARQRLAVAQSKT